MATHNQMTLILSTLKFILFIYSFSKYIVHSTCRRLEAHIIVLQRRLYRLKMILFDSV